MRKLIFFIVFIALVSCKPFSKKEENVLETSKDLLEGMILQRQNEIKDLMNRMDWNIVDEGNKDRRIYDEMNEQLLLISDCDLSKSKNELNKEFEGVIKNQKLLPEWLGITVPYYEKLDSVLIMEWKINLKENVVNYYASMVGSSCLRFSIIKPFIECQSSEVVQGQEYKASFFLGELLHGRFVGKGLENNKLNFLPDSIIGKKSWEGKAIHGRDTFDIFIPYEVVFCPK
jgi:hypothetical protein